MFNIWILIAIGVVLVPIISEYAKKVDEKIDRNKEVDLEISKDELEKLSKRSKNLQRIALGIFILIAIIMAYITRKMLPPM